MEDTAAQRWQAILDAAYETNAEAARAINVSKTAIGNWREGTPPTRRGTIEKIERALPISHEEIKTLPYMDEQRFNDLLTRVSQSQPSPGRQLKEGGVLNRIYDLLVQLDAKTEQRLNAIERRLDNLEGGPDDPNRPSKAGRT